MLILQRHPRAAASVFGLLLLGACTVLAAPQRARAQAPAAAEQGAESAQAKERRAKVAFERGRAHYEHGEFGLAADAFAEAYALSGKHALLYNMYVAYRDASRQREAADALRAYLERAEEVDNRGQLEARLGALEAGIAEREAAEAAGQQAETEAKARAQAGEASLPPADDRWWRYPTVLLAVGGGLMAASIPTGVVARSKSNELEADCRSGTCDASLKSTADTGRALAVTTDVLLFTGVATAIGGAIWMLLARPDEAPEAASRQVRPTVACGPGACGGSLAVTF